MIREGAIVFWNSNQVVSKKKIKEEDKSNQMGPDVDRFIGQHKQTERNTNTLASFVVYNSFHMCWESELWCKVN